MNKNKLSFSQFLDFFPELEMPVILTDDNLSVFSKENKVLPAPMIAEYIMKYDNTEPDEFTEYIPCFKIPNSEHFVGIVYWKAQLLNYEYHIVTYDLQGNFITGKVIAGIITNGNTLIKSVATIDEDWIIHIVSGEDDANSPNYSADDSKAYTMELLSTGDIIFSLNDEDPEIG